MNQQPNKKFEEITLSTEPIFTGKVITLQVDKIQLPNGQTATREIVKHPGAVAVLAIHDNKMIVVEQYRKPLERSQVEIPAGKLDRGENPLDAALRELKEETGYTSESIRLIASFATSPGFADEMIHMYLAENLVKGEAKPDEDEFLECEAITLKEAQQYIREQRINDAKTIMAVYAWQIYQLTGQIG